MRIQSFEKDKAQPSHGGTILAAPVLPPGLAAPFGHAWGYLENHAAMESHSHPTEEIYLVVRGRGVVEVDGERREVGPGDVIEIPPNAPHTMICENSGPLLWAALWWNVYPANGKNPKTQED